MRIWREYVDIQERFGIQHVHLLWWNLVSCSSKINLDVSVHAGDGEEDPRTPSSSFEESAQPEDDGPLVLLEEMIVKGEPKQRSGPKGTSF